MLTYRKNGRTVDVAPSDRTRRGYYAGDGWELVPPAKTALKPAWVEFAVAKGVPFADADAMTLTELHDHFAETPDTPAPDVPVGPVGESEA